MKTPAPDDRGMFCRLLICACALLFLSAGAGRAEEPAKPTDAKPIRLFDGKTLQGWEVLDHAGSGGAEVKQGAIRLKQGEPITSLVWKGEKLPKFNYELTMQARRLEGSDFFATVTFPVGDSYCSLVLGGWGGGLVGLSSINGADASENETTDYFDFEKNRWYKIRVCVTGTRLQAWIDEKKIADVDHTENQISVRIEMELSKPLGLASFQTIGEVRDIQIQRLAAGDDTQGQPAK